MKPRSTPGFEKADAEAGRNEQQNRRASPEIKRGIERGFLLLHFV
jgi:hypothetical protein